MSSGDEDDYMFSCDKCSFVNDSEEEFKSHYKSLHKNEAIHFCRGCGHVFTAFTEMIDHIKNDCTKEEMFALQCGIRECDFESSNPFKFTEHCKIFHRSITLLPCVNCSKFFTFPSFLIKHLQLECENGPVKSKSKKTEKTPKKKRATRSSVASLKSTNPVVVLHKLSPKKLEKKPTGRSAGKVKGEQAVAKKRSVVSRSGGSTRKRRK